MTKKAREVWTGIFIACCIIGIIVGAIFAGFACYDYSNAAIKDYQEVEDWIDEYPEMKPMFHEFTWEDKHMQNWEYWKLHEKYQDLEALDKIQDIENNEQNQYKDKRPSANVEKVEDVWFGNPAPWNE